MGCLASKPASDEEKQEICKVCAKDMMNLCVDEAMTDPSQIKIVAPPALTKIKETSAKLRAAAAEAKSAADAEGEEAAAEAEPAEGGGGAFGFGGMISSVLNTGADLVGQAVEFAADMGNKGISKALEGMSDMLDSAIQQVEEPMTTIGKDLVTGKKVELTNSLKEYIGNAAVPNAVALCMESEQPDAISKLIIGEAKGPVAEKLQPVVVAGVEKNPAIKAWDSCIEKYNGAIDKLKQMQETVQLPLADWAPEKVELDLKKYICEEAVGELGRLMGEAEGRRRANPEKMGKFPEIFEKVFKKRDTKNMTQAEKDKDEVENELTAKDYEAVTKNNQVAAA